MCEVNVLALKNAHQIREYEEKKTQERRRNLLYLIAQYLKEEGYLESAITLTNEGHLTSLVQVCDNVDLASILQDFESYYYVRFQRYPKICKKVGGDEGPFVAARKLAPKPVVRRPPVVENAAGDSQKNKPSKQPCENKSSKNDNDENDKNPAINVTGVSKPPPKTDVDDIKPRKKLKPLPAFRNHTVEWIEMAELITKEIFLDNLNVRWDDVKGLDEAKRLLKEAVVYPIKYPDLFQGVLAPWKGLLLFGPPGTGKTLLAKAVATETSTTFFNISASTIVSKWRGDSEKLVRVLFDLARYHAPSTIFLDEIEALASKRESLEHEASRRLKTELLIQLDGLSQSKDQVFLLATSNLPWELDPAMLRRLEKRILVDLPNSEARELMLKHYLPPTLQTQPEIKCDVYYGFLAEEMKGYSGSDIKLVCKEAAMATVRGVFEQLENPTQKSSKVAVRCITTDQVQKALDRTRPSAAHFGEQYQLWQEQFGSL